MKKTEVISEILKRHDKRTEVSRRGLLTVVRNWRIGELENWRIGELEMEFANQNYCLYCLSPSNSI